MNSEADLSRVTRLLSPWHIHDKEVCKARLFARSDEVYRRLSFEDGSLLLIRAFTFSILGILVHKRAHLKLQRFAIDNDGLDV